MTDFFSGKSGKRLEENAKQRHPWDDSVNSGGDDMAEAKIAKLEVDVKHIINTMLTDIKQDVRELRVDIKSTEKMMIDKFDLLTNKFDSFKGWFIGILLTSLIIPILVALVTTFIKP